MEAPKQKELFGHPIGLSYLFLTEMWERFSFYGMRALLTLYMVKVLFVMPDVGERVMGYTAIKGFLEGIFGPLAVQPLSSQIYGFYTAFVYLTPFFGGLIADRYIGKRNAVILGGILMTIGHFLMAVESQFFLALFFLILGNGAFKPNISTQVGELYKHGDPRRDRAFSIFYVGINVGAFFSPLVCGTLGQSSLGYHSGFAAAGVGMIVGLVIYLLGQKHLPEEALRQARLEHKPVERQPMTTVEKRRIAALLTICFCTIFFWAAYEQQGNTIQLWVDQYTNWKIGGWTIPSSWYQSLNPFLIFSLTPVIVGFWAWLSRRGKEPMTVVKMAIGIGLVGLAFAVMVLAALAYSPERPNSAFYLILFTLLITLGELYVSPIGLSLVTKLAPARMVSMLMGVWFLATFIGNYAAGYIGTFFNKVPKPVFFGMVGAMAVAVAVLLVLLIKPIQSGIGGAEAAQDL